MMVQSMHKQQSRREQSDLEELHTRKILFSARPAPGKMPIFSSLVSTQIPQSIRYETFLESRHLPWCGENGGIK